MRLLKIMQENERFSQTEQAIVQYMLEHPKEVAELTTREIAAKTYTSPAAVFRLTQKLGLKGYNEFRIKFTSEISRVNPESFSIRHRPVTQKDKPEDVVRKIAALEVEAIEETKNEFDIGQLEAILTRMEKAEVINIYAYDQNYALAQMAVYNFMQAKLPVVAYNSMNSQISSALLADKKHLAIIISRSGENRRLIRLAEILKRRGVHTVLLTVSPHSPLVSLCSEYVYIANTTNFLDLGGMLFSVGVRYFIDTIFAMRLARRYDEIESFTDQFDDACGSQYDDKRRIW